MIRRNIFPYNNPDLTALAVPSHSLLPLSSPPSRMFDSPPPNKSSLSIWTRRVFGPLGGVIAEFIEDLQLDVAVPVDDLRPNPTYTQITSTAAYDIRFCEELFDQWMTKLDKASSKKPDSDRREQELRFYLKLLKDEAGQCSNEMNRILQLHVRFASLMAQRIDNVSKSQYDLKYDDSETTKIAISINKISRSLSVNVSTMKDILKSFASALEEVQVAVKEQSLTEKFLGWLKYLLKAIVSIVAAVCSPISSLLSRVEPNPQYLATGVSTLGRAAAEFCRVDPENEFASLDTVILFLKKIVPREAQNAQEKLKEFNEALYIMGLERRMRAGGRVTLYGDPAAVAEEWRDLAKQYQSMLPDDEDPAI
ncbi:hypothetical protein BGY98DRAFT_936260 [Russula aff. rugulosa BPL654]|nr:hypothetical protein BGY98DRAFT_936260 [Russula aff. rugulosa BPL654]